MLTFQEEQRIRQIIKDEVPDLVKKELHPLEVNIDKILKIVTSSNQEHVLTKTKVNKLEKRMKKVETKLKIKSPDTTSVFA